MFFYIKYILKIYKNRNYYTFKTRRIALTKLIKNVKRLNTNFLPIIFVWFTSFSLIFPFQSVLSIYHIIIKRKERKMSI